MPADTATRKGYEVGMKAQREAERKRPRDRPTASFGGWWRSATDSGLSGSGVDPTTPERSVRTYMMRLSDRVKFC